MHNKTNTLGTKTNYFKNGMKHGIGIFVSIAILGIITVFAANWYDSLTSNAGDPLTATKWNNVVKATVPTGAIMAFNLTTCPDTWTEYLPARGRFLRGIDSTGINDTVRVLGDLQTDDLKSHAHQQSVNSGPGSGTNAAPGVNSISPTGYGTYTSLFGGTETRPKNVAVLFCVKQ
ncbi:hypothetical protein M0P65_03995 [Candidatus Gracilibacteria bacterium]|nr:hypothetical protein [Candidatus Gracilibacteria bacterium]